MRLKVAKEWASVAHEKQDTSALEAYQIALGLLPQLAAFGLDVRSRPTILITAQSNNLGSDAAACAIDLHRYEEAVELLEAGRSVFWSQSLHLRTPLNDLQNSHPVWRPSFYSCLSN
jgi:hypothetical protein